MARVMIECPKTNRQVYVGLNLDWAALEALEPEEHSFQCSACGEEHRWTRGEANLVADGSGD